MSSSYFVTSTGEFKHIGWIDTNSSKGIIGFDETTLFTSATVVLFQPWI